ncbi:MAG: threonine synthase [Chitinophagaceae bacterium]|nr:threonine synthase [Chitinophagaceae bacterium]MBK7679461.1 threonine synthase [Chitinophagaceae bacterium]MBK9659629.1 threonine synthase [Chitinophagaceae bacterium]MBK9936833.1 threonine synthase [Chitinophagaceae bacterium]MBL0068604.1 threonine synthase [Chitinophagaceae bacterium]
MKYYSTNRQSPIVDFKQATIAGQAPDKGLYFPETIPQVDAAMIKNITSYSNEEIAFRVIKPYTGNTIADEQLFQIVSETVNFPIPLVKVNDTISSLELYHGPTLAFKDVGARFMSRCLEHFVNNNSGTVTVLVATSGDTGGAVANGFYGVEGVEVVILYPSGKVSPVQEKQLTTLGKNIKALEVDGTFDDCQKMVKQAFMDKDINDKLFLTSANSINVARWLPQQFYYFFAYKQWADKNNPPVISVPSGNFGNICAGILAMQSGLPVQHFIAASNANDIVTEYLLSQKLIPKQAVATLSNAMDVGNPSNFVRILEIFRHQFPALKSKLSSYSITDEETIATIKTVYEKENYVLDPHGAVGFLSLERYLQSHPRQKGIVLETAHPVKFPDAVESCIGKPIDIPVSVQTIMKKEKMSILIKADYGQLKEYLLQ